MDLIKFNQQNIPKTFDESFFHIQKVRILKISKFYKIWYLWFEVKKYLLTYY